MPIYCVSLPAGLAVVDHKQPRLKMSEAIRGLDSLTMPLVLSSFWSYESFF